MKPTIYKTTIVALLLFFIPFMPTSQAQQTKKELVGVLIKHQFYSKDMPLNEVMGIQKGFQKLDDGEQHTVLHILVPDDFVAPKTWKKYEIKRSNVVNADKFEAKVQFFDEMKKATHSADKQFKNPKIGQKLPGTFTLQDLDGNTWTQDSLRNRVTVVNVWYSGCGPCRKEMPELSTWKTRFPEVIFLSANFEKPEIVKAITEKQGFNWTHLPNDRYFTQWVGSEGFPLTLIIAMDGTLQYLSHKTSNEIREEVFKRLKWLTTIQKE